MKVRNHNWYDSVLEKKVFGVQCFHDGVWKIASISGSQIWCDTKEERNLLKTKFVKLSKIYNKK